MSYFFSAYETTSSKAKDTSLCPIVPGQYLICKDSGDVFYDTGDGVRKHLTDIIDLETDAERIAILTPLDKIYFVKETAHFWRYINAEWVDLSTSGGISTVSVTIPTTGWGGDSTSGWPKYYDIAVSGVTANDYAEVTLSPAGLLTAAACNLCPACETMAGKVRVRAASVPTAAITAQCRIEKSA